MFETVHSYEWMKDGEPLGSVSNILFVGNGTLHISRLMAANEGVYQCFAGNIYGRTMSALAELRMATTDASSPETNRISAVERQPVMIRCRRTTKCFPTPRYSWKRRRQQLSPVPIYVDRRRQIDQNGKLFLSGG